MLYLYLDESGDLGFDFFTKKPSRYFTVTILAVKGTKNNRLLINAVKKTIKRKIRKKGSRELKGSQTSFDIKRYFYGLVYDVNFEIYSLSLNKMRVYNELAKKKDRVYNFIARNVLDKIPVEEASSNVNFIIDKSKNKKEIEGFNDYIIRNLKGRIDPRIPLDIYHYASQESYGLQATDLFSWGIFRTYERNDYEWYDLFKEKIKYDTLYL